MTTTSQSAVITSGSTAAPAATTDTVRQLPAVLLVDLKLAAYQPDVRDLRATSSMVAQYGSQPKAARVRKTLFKNSPQLRKLIALMGSWRLHHYSLTSPYVTDGPRLLARTAVQAYNEMYDQFAQKLEVLKEEFRAVYTQLIADDQKSLGDLFRPEDYPDSPEPILQRFYAIKQFLPLNNPEELCTLLADLGGAAEMRDALEQSIRGSFKASQFNVWARLGSHLAKLKTTLMVPTTGVKEATLANLAALTESIPLILIYQDDQLVSLSTEINHYLACLNNKMLTASGPGTVREALINQINGWQTIIETAKANWQPEANSLDKDETFLAQQAAALEAQAERELEALQQVQC